MPDRIRIWLGRGLLAVAAVLLGCWMVVFAESHAYQARLARLLQALDDPRAEPAVRHEAWSQGLVGRIRIPRIGISALVAEGTTVPVLRHAVGHLAGTALPGEPGNAVLAAHRDTYFRQLGSVSAGDLIRIETPRGEFAYRVDSVLVVEPDRDDLLDHTDAAVLTLVTCYPFHWVGPAPRRFIVRAHRTAASDLSMMGGCAPPGAG